MASNAEQYTPKKLTVDAIVESMCQIGFNSTLIPEVIIGRLSDFYDDNDEFVLKRLPIASFPYEARSKDPNLRNQPIMELKHNNNKLLIRFSENIISYHIVGLGNYIGWEAFRAELLDTYRKLFDKIKISDISSISLRYINAITGDMHHIQNMHDLNFEVAVKNQVLECPLNLNYLVQNDDTHLTTTRVAHPEFVQGNIPEAANAIIDVEVSSPRTKFKVKGLDDVMDWIDSAHQFEKEAFFRLIPDAVINKLEEK